MSTDEELSEEPDVPHPGPVEAHTLHEPGTPLCIDCQNFSTYGDKCVVHMVVYQDAVTGDSVFMDVKNAEDERSQGQCGPEGKLFKKASFARRMLRKLDRLI